LRVTSTVVPFTFQLKKGPLKLCRYLDTFYENEQNNNVNMCYVFHVMEIIADKRLHGGEG